MKSSRFLSGPLLLLAGTLVLLPQDSLRGAENGEALPDPLQEAIDEVQRKKHIVEERQEMDAALRTTRIDTYNSALKFYEDARLQQERENSFRTSITSAPEEIRRLGQAPDPTVTTNSILESLPPDPTIADLEQQITAAKAEQARINQELATLAGVLEQLQTRPARLRDQQRQTATALAEIDASLQSLGPEGEPHEEPVARQAVLQARKAFRLAEAAALEQENLGLALRLELTRARHEAKTREGRNQGIRVGALENELVRLRQSEAQEAARQAAEAEAEAADKHPLVARLAEEQTQLTKERGDLVERIDTRLRQEREAIVADREAMDGNFKLARDRIRDIGLSDSLAVRLLDQWRRLPDLRTNHDSMSRRKESISRAVSRRLHLEDSLLNLPRNTTDQVQLMIWVESFLPEGESVEDGETWNEVSHLLDSRTTTLASLVAEYDRLLQELAALDYEENKFIELVEEYDLFLKERLLWIPSAPTVGVSAVGEAWEAVRWLFSGPNRQEIWRSAAAFPRERPFLTAVLGLLLVGSVLARPAMRRKERQYAKEVKRISTDSFGTSLKALVLLLLQSAPLAAVLALLGWHLTDRETEVDILRGLGVSLLYSALHLFGILVLLNACRPNGLGRAHFQWNSDIAALLYRQLLWFFPVVLCSTVLIDLSEEVSEEASRTGLSRLTLILLMAASTWFFYRTMRPRDGILSLSLTHAPGGWLVRMRHLWHRLLILVPISLAILSGLGYHHTAVQLTRQFAITISFLIGLFVLHQLVRRWFVARERRIRLQKWLTQRQATSRKSSHEGDPESLLVPEAEEEEFDVRNLGQQTRRFLHSLMNFSLLLGIWLIWSDVLPALNMLDSLELWQTQTVIDGQTAYEPITLNHLALALIILVVMIVSVRNIGGALEIGILQNLPLEAGSRYAIISVTQYVLVLIGTGFIFNVMGFTLAQFGWIMTALSVGLGFGLQEVVANFVSGIILLAERPIRVGDIVTVGDVDGVVSRIRIRATTITNWNRQELVVPNKEFITGRILNWTLSNTVNRIVIVVGVAYGTDTEKARQLLLEAASRQSRLMNDPAPMATFEGFDDSSLRLVLRCYLPSLSHRLSVTTQLHTEIARLFDKEGIEISFPQQDINLRSFAPFPTSRN